MAEFMRVEGLKVHYPIRSGFFNRITDYVYAVDGVDLVFEEGKTYGLVGESGSGKSTIGKAIIGLEKITDGKIFYEGKDITSEARKRRSDYRRNVQMIFQDAMSSFNPKKRITDVLSEPLRNFENMTPEEEKRKMIELLHIVGLSEDALNKYPHEFSGGQRQRIGVARAVAINPKLIIADEPVSALDLSVQAQVLNFMRRIQDEYNTSYLFISHDLGVVKHMCDELAIMYRGRFTEYGSSTDIYGNPKHIYTRRLLSAIPQIDPNNREENKMNRLRVEKEYQTNASKYFTEEGRVYDLKELSSTHKVALKDVNGQGGVN
ncbi:MAG TPA: ATP-binding cassette domain-containing protein [Globicatella sulfidifaciens]|uniref:ABC transporter ATP-binding protein n=1 Tax=Globicatella sulfidifaciens TaxID=136093 RepID=A0A7X8C2P2_9LACT|nr:ATP-binding cassette domain-containing protein [Globicatella sulfidifaciens]NLJ17723.1 ABC transporter ATP-binding protein [Globicatella sulfidifaciens]HJF16338.1 ATP-binding cassette domain-containing protein [Globicatella sulfidifaciens]